jgi:sulfatase maturation enzyme AslB (radical SAM superfamily)
LKGVVEKTFICETDPVIAISTPFNAIDVYNLRPVLKWALEKYPNIKIIHGGSRNYDESLSDLIDVFFLGRSMEMFDAWLDNKDLTPYIERTDPLVLANYNFNEKIDNPVVPITKDDDCLSNKDILGFEVGVGCKFNCTFCNYELRNAKITKLADPLELRNYLQEAHSKYGISNFFASDDTLNETDEKLEIVLEAMSGLDFHPEITAYARLDLITSRKQQLELLGKIKFRSLFFGIESFNPEASKAVRKKSGLGNNYETLKNIRDISPDTYTVGGMIVGLNKDSEQSIFESVDRVINEKLLSSFQFGALSITRPTGIIGADFYSDLDKDPEKFGYKIIDVINFHHGNKNMASYAWQSDWTDSTKANDLTNRLYEYCRGKIDILNHLEYAGLYSLGVYNSTHRYEAIKNRSYTYSTLLKQQYIKNKLQTL